MVILEFTYAKPNRNNVHGCRMWCWQGDYARDHPQRVYHYRGRKILCWYSFLRMNDAVRMFKEFLGQAEETGLGATIERWRKKW